MVALSNSGGASGQEGSGKNASSPKVDVLGESTEYLEKTSVHKSYMEYPEDGTRFRRFLSSFKRAEHFTGKDLESLNDNSKHESLKQTIKPRHVTMISLGTGIGTGLLVGIGTSLHNGGPGGLAVGYLVMGCCVYCVIQAAGELAVCYPALTGGFNAYPSFLVDPALGFATAWLYCLQWLAVFPLELVTAAITIRFWGAGVNSDVYVLFFYILVIGINFFGARGYAEAEFFFNTCKVLMITIFFITGILTNTGAIGDGHYIGGKYWNDPGTFAGKDGIDKFKGLMATLVNAAFSFGCSEFIALTAAEQSNPRKSIPSAAKKMLYKAFVVFLGSVILIGFLVPYNSPELLGSAGSAVHASPFVLAFSLHKVHVIPHFVNAVIVMSVLSVGNSAFYSSSRLLLSLAEQNYAPSIFKYVDRAGRPLIGMCVSITMGLISFVAASSKREEVFKWLLAISGLSQLFTWISICLSHIRFRKAIAVQGRSLGELGYKSQVGVWGSYFATIMMVVALIAQFWVAVSPVGTNKPDILKFLEAYLTLPIYLVLYFGYRIYNRYWKLYIKAEDIKVDFHRKIFDEDVLKQEDIEYKVRLKNSSIWYRISDFWC